MDIRKFVIQKRKHESDDSSSEDEGSPTQVTVSQSQPKATSSQAVVKDVGMADLPKSQRKRINWNHATEMLKLHNESKWHRDSTVYVQMAEQGEKQNAIKLHSAAIAKKQEEQKVKNRAILLKHHSV